MKKILILFGILLLATTLLSSCGTTKQIAYLQNSDSIDFAQSRFLYDARIMPKDQITISVNTTTPEASVHSTCCCRMLIPRVVL